MPEAILGPIGFLDDLALAAYVLNSVLKTTSPDVLKRHWAGEQDVLEAVSKVMDAADQLLGSGLWSRLKKLYETFSPSAR